MYLPVPAICIVLALTLVPTSLWASDSSVAPTVALGVEPIGYAVYPIPTRGAFLDYYLTPDGVVGISYARGQHQQLLAENYAEMTMVRYRWLIGSLTRVNIGAGYRTLGTRYSVRTSTGEDADVDTSMKVVLAELSFGTHLELGVLQISCDWLGISVPLSKVAYKDGFPETADATAKDANEEEFNRIAFVPTLQFVRLGVGVVF